MGENNAQLQSRDLPPGLDPNAGMRVHEWWKMGKRKIGQKIEKKRLENQSMRVNVMLIDHQLSTS